jgi:hypothetical protein
VRVEPPGKAAVKVEPLELPRLRIELPGRAETGKVQRRDSPNSILSGLTLDKKPRKSGKTLISPDDP